METTEGAIIGNWVVDRLIGQGGMGKVYQGSSLEGRH